MPQPSSVTSIQLDARPPASRTAILRRAGVERIFDQFLQRARRPFDHLAGGDAIDEMLGQAASY